MKFNNKTVSVLKGARKKGFFARKGTGIIERKRAKGRHVIISK